MPRNNVRLRLMEEVGFRSLQRHFSALTNERFTLQWDKDLFARQYKIWMECTACGVCYHCDQTMEQFEDARLDLHDWEALILEIFSERMIEHRCEEMEQRWQRVRVRPLTQTTLPQQMTNVSSTAPMPVSERPTNREIVNTRETRDKLRRKMEMDSKQRKREGVRVIRIGEAED